jgi:hypothetical protein
MMVKAPTWLPELLRYADYGGDWEKFIKEVYGIFENDFKKTKPVYQKLPVNHDSRIQDGKEAGFWHIVQSEEKTVGARVPDLRRCEHIPWPKPTIENSSDSVVSTWEVEIKRPHFGRQKRVIIWLENFDYLVVLRSRPTEFILVTAYCVIYESHRNKLRKQREEYYKAKAAP